MVKKISNYFNQIIINITKKIRIKKWHLFVGLLVFGVFAVIFVGTDAF